VTIHAATIAVPAGGVPDPLQHMLGTAQPAQLEQAQQLQKVVPENQSPELRQAFDDFVGQTFFSHLLKAMRQTVDKPAYFHGGRAEEVFQSQLDQLLVENVTDASAATFTEPMFELFTMNRH